MVTPTPQPMAAVMPAISPWSTQPRGNREGVREAQPNRTAPSVPLQVYRGSHRRHRRAGRSSAAAAAGGGGSATSVPPGAGVVVGSAVMSVSAPRRTDGRRAGTGRAPTERVNRGSRSRSTIGVMGPGRRSRARTPAISTTADVGLVVAAAMAPGTFAPSLSPRSTVDQGGVTGLATGLHYLLAAGAQEALGIAARTLADGAPPAAQRRVAIAVDAAAVPLGLAVLRALPPRAADPFRGVVRQAAWRLGVAGLSGALLDGARLGAQAIDDRLRLGGR